MPVLKCLACTERNVRQEVEGKIEREEQEAVAQIEAEFQPLLVALTESWEAAMRSAVLAVARVAVRELVVDQQQHYHKDHKHYYTPRRHARLHLVRREIWKLFYRETIFIQK